MTPRILCALVLALLPLGAAAQSQHVAMTVFVPRDAAIASVTAHAGEALDLCAPGEELRRDVRGWVCEARVRHAAQRGLETDRSYAERGDTAAGALDRARR